MLVIAPECPPHPSMGWFLAIHHPISVPAPLSSQEAVGGAERGRKTLQEGAGEGGMEPRGVGMGWLCMAVLCSGAALTLKEDSGHGADGLELLTDPNTTPGDTEELTPWPTASPAPPWSRDPIPTSVLPQRDAAGNRTRTRDRASSTNDSSDLGALDATSTPRAAAAQEERAEPERPRALESTETTFSGQDPQVLTPMY
ncbi:uncharacterized protein LOC133215582 isoform X2 [Neopsephotus bourkii]|uniref:uncharacterized protein LOC133215582 isoform X2 n=1 Tax=Neopsephotus bourkii TaxID=309878 RepID=UPI002AA529D8|nr:uncharacterized protein LOC133215582 isoform X2 [Neopsephotus bourkii]